eukprot:scaffold24661_cov132-Cylindrotheca_fusiformis.AAC.1
MMVVITVRRRIALVLCGLLAASVCHLGVYQIRFSNYEAYSSADPTVVQTTAPFNPTASPATSLTVTSKVSRRTTAHHRTPVKIVNAKVSKRKTRPHQKPLLTIVTGFSSDHFMEGIKMLQTLIDVKYFGPIYIYLLHGHNEPLSTAMKEGFEQLMKESPFKETIVEMEVEEYESYCFKPRIVQHVLTLLAAEDRKASSRSRTPQVLLWSDSSTRFRLNPATGAKRMVRDQVDFVAVPGVMGMGENTHQQTYDYLNMTKADFVHRMELASGTYLVNLKRKHALEHILKPFIDCGLRDCHTCMAPVGTRKRGNGRKIQGPPSSDYIAHRQDQSVLSLLAYQCEDRKACNISVGEKNYLHCLHRRADEAEALSFQY